jgi:hypothetical protein
MHRLILTTSDSGAGCLKAARIADRVLALAYRLVCGPVPAAPDPATFLTRRAGLVGPDMTNWEGWGDSAGADLASAFNESWLELTTRHRDFEGIEIWVDPIPNAQLQLVQLLHWIEPYPDLLVKLVLVHPDIRIGARRPEDSQNGGQTSKSSEPSSSRR